MKHNIIDYSDLDYITFAEIDILAYALNEYEVLFGDVIKDAMKVGE